MRVLVIVLDRVITRLLLVYLHGGWFLSCQMVVGIYLGISKCLLLGLWLVFGPATYSVSILRVSVSHLFIRVS